jgi:hypothetical protein
MDTKLLEVLKWVGIALAAGFVGYFGRYLAMLIIDRVRKKKAKLPTTAEAPPSQDIILEQQKLKLEKKKAKAEAKKAKKG